MPQLAAGAAAAAGWFAAQSVLVQIGIRLAVGFIISAAASQLLSKPKGTSAFNNNTGRQDSVRQAVAPRRSIVGETLVGGTIAHVQTTGGQNKFLSILTMRANHEVSEWVEMWWGQERLIVTGNDVTSPVHGKYTDRAWSYRHDGEADQAADAEMMATSGGIWTANHRLRGIAYDHLRLKWKATDIPDGDEDVPPNIWAHFRMDQIRWIMRGLAPTDTRDAVARYSNNPALLTRWFLAKIGVDDDEINDTTTSAAANICDEQVPLTQASVTFTASASTDVLTLTSALANLRRGNVVRVSNSGGGLPTGLAAATDYYVIPVGPLTYKLASSFANAMAGTAIDLSSAGTGTHTITLMSEARYTANGIIEDSDNPADVLRGLIGAMAGCLTYSAGKFEIHAGASATSVLTLNEAHYIGPMQVVHRRSRQAVFNGVKATFIDPDAKYQAVTAPVVSGATYIAQDGGRAIVQPLDLPLCDSPARAQRLAMIELQRCRQQISVSATVNLIGLKLKVWDVVALDSTKQGWTAKEFRIVGWTLNSDGSVQMQLAEEAASMWTWSDTDASATDTAPDTELPDARSVTAPPVPIMVVEEQRQVTGGVVTILQCAVTGSPDVMTARYRWRYRKVGDTLWRALPSTQPSVEITAVDDGAAYEIAVAAENWIGSVSDYISKTHAVIGATAEPDDVAGFTLDFVDTHALLSWTAGDDIDLDCYVIRFSPAVSGATWATATDLIPRVPKPATSVKVPAQVGTYLIKAQDYGRRRSQTATSVVSNVTAMRGLNVVQAIAEAPTFAGTKSSVVMVDGVLKLDSSILFDSVSGNFEDVTGLFDGGGGNIAASGTYAFSHAGVGYLDLGATYTSRLTPSMTVTSEDMVNSFDAGVGDFDDRPGLFDGTISSAESTNAYIEVATTTDNPAGTPTWSDWKKLLVPSDHRFRAVKFRATLTTLDPTATPIVSALSVSVDMEDRIVSVSDVAAAALGTAVTFSPAFKATPTVGITAKGLSSGDRWDYTVAPTATGFTIRFFDSAGTGKTATFSYLAQGYGVNA
jgi:hypothetical protein